MGYWLVADVSGGGVAADGLLVIGTQTFALFAFTFAPLCVKKNDPTKNPQFPIPLQAPEGIKALQK